MNAVRRLHVRLQKINVVHDQRLDLRTQFYEIALRFGCVSVVFLHTRLNYFSCMTKHDFVRTTNGPLCISFKTPSTSISPQLIQKLYTFKTCLQFSILTRSRSCSALRAQSFSADAAAEPSSQRSTKVHSIKKGYCSISHVESK